MNNNLKIFILVLILFNLISIVRILKLKRLSIKYGVFWIVLLALLIISACFPGIYLFISDFLGFEKTSNMIFLLGFFFLFYLNFVLITNISLLNEKVKSLVQEISILKERVDKNERK